METTPVSTDNQTQSIQETLPKNVPCCSPQNKFICILAALIFALIVSAGSFLLGKYSSRPRPVGYPAPQISPTPTQITFIQDPTADWETHTLNAVNMEFKTPSFFSSFGQFKEQIKPGEKGTYLCATYSKETSFLVKPIFAGGYSCVISRFGVGTTSVDFEAGRMAGFTDLQGYTIEGNRFFAKFSDKKFEISNYLVTQMGGPGGLPMLKIKGADSVEGEFQGPIAGTPGEGKIGALINTNNSTYPGLAIEMELTQNLTEELFTQILSTFRFD